MTDIRETVDVVARGILREVEGCSLPIIRPFPGHGLVERLQMGWFQKLKEVEPRYQDLDHSELSVALSDRFRRMAGELRAGEHEFRSDRGRGAQLYDHLAAKLEQGREASMPN